MHQRHEETVSGLNLQKLVPVLANDSHDFQFHSGFFGAADVLPQRTPFREQLVRQTGVDNRHPRSPDITTLTLRKISSAQNWHTQCFKIPGRDPAKESHRALPRTLR